MFLGFAWGEERNPWNAFLAQKSRLVKTGTLVAVFFMTNLRYRFLAAKIHSNRGYMTLFLGQRIRAVEKRRLPSAVQQLVAVERPCLPVGVENESLPACCQAKALSQCCLSWAKAFVLFLSFRTPSLWCSFCYIQQSSRAWCIRPATPALHLASCAVKPQRPGKS